MLNGTNSLALIYSRDGWGSRYEDWKMHGICECGATLMDHIRARCITRPGFWKQADYTFLTWAT